MHGSSAVTTPGACFLRVMKPTVCPGLPMFQAECGPTVGWACSAHLGDLVADIQAQCRRAVLVTSLDGPLVPGIVLAQRAGR
jgi:hypothetical protein